MKLHVDYLPVGKKAAVTEEVLVSASARHLWEEKHGSILDAMRTIRSDWADFLAYTTLFRSGRTELELLEWLDTVSTIRWEMPEDKLQAFAETLGVIPTAVDADPTGASATDHSLAG